MIDLAETPAVNVQTAEYARLLGYPRGWVFEGRALELSEWARQWYASHGRPWILARGASTLEVRSNAVQIDEVSFSSTRLKKLLQAAGAHGVVLVAVGAGPELEAEAQRLWRDGRPDEYFFLEVYGSAVVEHLVTVAGARLCAWADGERMAMLPHDSPGYPEWPIDEQSRLLDLLNSVRRPGQPAVPVEALDSGMLRPKKSLLAVFGVTRHVDRVQGIAGLVPCELCAFAPCQYRRAPYRRAFLHDGFEPLTETAPPPASALTSAVALDLNAIYGTNLKALRRWAAERLTLASHADGSIDATFRYEGTTCTNMGRALEFVYEVTLGPEADGYPIRSQRCAPAPGDDGHRAMCRYLTDAASLMASIEREAPLAGRPLNDVLAWGRPQCSAGCFCDAAARGHKWGLVLETIHFALAREAAAGKAPR